MTEKGSSETPRIEDMSVPPDPTETRLRLTSILVVLGVAVGLGVAFILSWLAPDVLLFLLFEGLLLVLAVALTLERSPYIQDGTIYLDRSIRRTDGTRTRAVSLSEITGVDPTVTREGFQGLSLTLIGGTRAFLAQSSFGSNGLQVMEALSRRFGRSFQEETRQILMEGRGGAGFRAVGLARVGPDVLKLRTGLPTTSKGVIRQVKRVTVESIEEVVVPYAGAAFLLTLVDGTRFIITRREARRKGLERSPHWARFWRGT